MLEHRQADTQIQYLFPEELTDIVEGLFPEGLFPESPVRAFGLTGGLLICTDTTSGETWKKPISPEQAAAIFWIYISGNDDSQSLAVRFMYELAAPALVGCPSEMRPIP